MMCELGSRVPSLFRARYSDGSKIVLVKVITTMRRNAKVAY